MKNHREMLEHIRTSLKPEGRLVMVDLAGRSEERRSRPREKQIEDHEIAPILVERELREAGFELVERRDVLVDRPSQDTIQWLIAAKRRP